MSVICYSQRILNPFRGVMNIISTGGADAVTIDGINWILYIHDTFDCPMDDPEEFFEIEMPDIRFGEWSREKGLRRSPLIESYHYDAIQTLGHVLLQALEQHADETPFAFRDSYELWLLDEKNLEPLALLDSVCCEQELYKPDTLKWDAGVRCRQQFHSEIELFDHSIDNHADLLTKIINRSAGTEPKAQWFHRNEENYGTGLYGFNIDSRLHGRELSPRLFPKMLIRRQWQDKNESALVDAFIHWLSPYLLLLDFLRDKQRMILENLACGHAILVDKMYPLYPKIVDKKSINAARVEAMLRKCNNTEKIKEDDKTINYFGNIYT